MGFVLAQFFPRPSFPTTMESSSGWCSTCFASKCKCSSTSKEGEHHLGNQQGKHQGGFSGVHETSFNIQSCSYQAARGHHQPIFQVSAKILFGHQNDITAMLESDKRQK